MNEDRELLELAAKAAGIEITWEHGQDYPERVEMFRGHLANYEPWNPLTDDGDALRLAVKLDLFAKPAFFHYRSLERFGLQEADDTTATRRAIVRTAAELGRSMP